MDIKFDLEQAVTPETLAGGEGGAAKGVARYLEGVRVQLLELAKKPGGIAQEEFNKVVTAVDELKTGYDATVNDLKMRLRDVPDPGYGEGSLKPGALRHIALSLQGGGGIRLDAHREERDQDFGPSFTRMEGAPHGIGKIQYNLLCRTAKSLDLEDKTAIRMHKRLCQLHDALVFRDLWRNGTQGSNYKGWESLPEYAEYQELASKFMVALADTAMSTSAATAGSGKEWVPTQILSAQIYPLIAIQLRVIAAFETVPMPGPTYAFPVQGSHVKSQALGENVDAAAATPAWSVSNFLTKLVTFTAKKHGTVVVPTMEWEQDAVVNSGQFIERDMAYALAAGLEDWAINGQKTTVIDDQTGWNATPSLDTKSLSDGLRRMFVSETGIAAYDFGAGTTAEGLAKIFGQQQDYGADPQRSIWVCSVAGLTSLLTVKTSTGQNVVMTYNEAGPYATFRTGTMAQCWGRDVIPSRWMPDTLNAAGVIPAPVGSRTAILHVYTDAVKIGERMGIVVSYSDQLRFLQDQKVFKAVMRNDIQPVYAPATNRIIGAGYNVPTT